MKQNKTKPQSCPGYSFCSFSLWRKVSNQSSDFIYLIDTTKSTGYQSRSVPALKPGGPCSPSEKIKTKYQRSMLSCPEAWEDLNSLL